LTINRKKANFGHFPFINKTAFEGVLKKRCREEGKGSEK
jgi:hypothetical protein